MQTHILDCKAVRGSLSTRKEGRREREGRRGAINSCLSPEEKSRGKLVQQGTKKVFQALRSLDIPPSRTRNSPVLSALLVRCQKNVWTASIFCNMCVVIGLLVLALTFFAVAMTVIALTFLSWAIKATYRCRVFRTPSCADLADNFCSKRLFWLLSHSNLVTLFCDASMNS